MSGRSFPPRPDERRTLDTWREPPLNRRSHRHLREIVPTARVAAAGTASALPAGRAVALDRAVVAVKLSSWPVPQDPAMLFDTLRMVDAVTAAS